MMQPLQTFPELYERVVVPGKFRPWAQDLIERARPIGPSERVLDLGCGTGIVSRILRERLGGAARITAVDLNPAMLAVARSIAPVVDWREANATALPFADAAFDLVLCQEMLQFPADRVAVLREIRRVLAPGGRLLASTWRARSEQPIYEAMGEVAERHLGQPNDRRFSLGDGAALRALAVEAGFTGARVETVTIAEVHAEFPVRLNVMAMAFDLSKLTDAERERRLAAVDAESAAELARFAVAGGFADTASANVLSAVKEAV